MRKTFNTTAYVKETGHGGVLRGIVQYDTLNEVNIRLSDGLKAFDYTGYNNIIFKVLKADGTTYIDSLGARVVATSPADGIITVTLAGQATAAVGLCQSLIEIYAAGEKFATARLNYEVSESLGVDEGSVVSEPDYPLLQNLVAEISALESAIRIAESNREIAEAARVSEETGYVAQAKDWAEEAEKYAKMTADVVEGDFATRAELDAVAGLFTDHFHDVSDIQGILPITKGGTGGAGQMSAANSLLVKSIGGGTEIASGADLDTYKTFGNYSCPMTATARTLKNCPVDVAFRMTVGKANGTSSYIYQEIEHISTGVRYYRVYGDGSWNAWQSTYGTAHKPTPAEIGAVAIGEGADTEEGYYIGTDSSTFELTFSFVPKVVFVTSTTAASRSMGVWVHGSPSLYHTIAERNTYSTQGFPVAFDEENKKLTVTSNFVSNGVTQPYLNWSGHRFNYVAIR